MAQTFTVKRVAELLQTTEDHIRDLIRRVKVISPEKQGRSYQITESELHTLREHMGIPLVRALVLADVEPPESDNVISNVDRLPHILWHASVYGDTSVAILVEAPSFTELTKLLSEIQSFSYVHFINTYIVHENSWHQRDEPPTTSNLACVLIRLEASSVDTVFNRLKEIKEVHRCGKVFGNWDIFAELRYLDADNLHDIVMNNIQVIRGITKTNTLISMPYIP